MSRWISDEPLKMVLGAAVEVFGNDQQHGFGNRSYFAR